MGKTEIISALGHLTPEELAEVRARLEQLTREGPRAGADGPGVCGSARVRSPRLADSSRSRDFAKQVIEIPANAQL